MGRPNFAIPAPDGTVYLIFSGQNPLRVAITLQAFDVSGQHIAAVSAHARQLLEAGSRQSWQCAFSLPARSRTW